MFASLLANVLQLVHKSVAHWLIIILVACQIAVDALKIFWVESIAIEVMVSSGHWPCCHRGLPLRTDINCKGGHYLWAPCLRLTAAHWQPHFPPDSFSRVVPRTSFSEWSAWSASWRVIIIKLPLDHRRTVKCHLPLPLSYSGRYHCS